MVNALPCLDVSAGNDQYTDEQAIWLIVWSYFCTLLFFALFCFLVFNIWHFMYKQGKWRVWSLRMFYSLTTLCVLLRIYVSVVNVCISSYFNLTFIFVPVVLKITVGIEQIVVIVELTIKVRENFRSLTRMQNQSTLKANKIITELVASKKKVARQVRALQWAISVFIILAIAGSTAVFIYKDLLYSDVDDNADRFHRLEYLEKTAKQMSWAFFTLAIGLAGSVMFLVKSVQRELNFFQADQRQFKSEFNRMYWMLIIFSLTYFCRWISDYFIVPMMTKVDEESADPISSPDTKLKTCTLSNGLRTLCLSFEFQIYYMGSSLLFDLIPLGLIAIFHYLSFRNVDPELRNSSLDTAEKRQHEKI